MFFRRYIENLAPGLPIDWDDMDRWALAYFPSDREMVTVDCMSVCEKMAEEGWLVRADPAISRFPLDDYFRTDKTARRSRGIDCQLIPSCALASAGNPVRNWSPHDQEKPKDVNFMSPHLMPSAMIAFGVYGDNATEGGKLAVKLPSISAKTGDAVMIAACNQVENVDGDFYEMHPDRTRYVRPAVANEGGQKITDKNVVLVTQIRSGLRTQMIFSLVSLTAQEFCEHFKTDDACEKLAAQVFEAGDDKFRRLIHGATKRAASDCSEMIAILEDDEAWFKDREPGHYRVRRPAPIERIVSPGITVVVVSQLEKDLRVRRSLALPDDMTEFVIRNGEDCLCSLQGGPSFLLPGSIHPRNGTVMK
jgi:hypothetical protein